MTASQHMVRANGLRFRTMVDGPPAGEMFILLHGFPEGAESWLRQVDAIAKAGHLAVAPDLRGYGLTDAPADEDSYAIGHLVDDVAGLIKVFGRESAHIAGHDWGAIVAWFFAARHPEMTKTLTVLSVGHPAAIAAASREDEDQKARSSYIRLFLMAGKAEQVLSEDDYRRLRQMFSLGPNPGAVPKSVIDHFAKSIARPGRLTAALNYYRAAPRGSGSRTPALSTCPQRCCGATRIQPSGGAARNPPRVTSKVTTGSRSWRVPGTGCSSSGRPR